jgi:ABC-type antimicrobial peptide transport system permease subunit
VFLAKVFTIFAALGLGLAVFGVYGVVAHSVAERRREIGVRIALGATPRDILRAVLRETVVIALSGIALGLLMTRNFVFLLPNYDVYNAPLFAAVALALFVVAAASAFAPAWRATLVDPTESLRSE